MNKRQIIYTVAGVFFFSVVLVYVFLMGGLNGKIVLPFLAHQKPLIDPHQPASVELADKLDEVVFDGLFNISADASGIVYEDGLGTLVNIDSKNVVSVRLNLGKKWHSSYDVKSDGDEVTVTPKGEEFFKPGDLEFTLRRIQTLGSLSPDYILISQALKTFSYEGPDDQNIVKFYFKDDREWLESDIKEVLAFKIMPENSAMNEIQYTNGTGPYLAYETQQKIDNYYKTPDANAQIPSVMLMPFVDNSTFTTELNSDKINAVLNVPFGSLSPVLNDPDDFFAKSSISTRFFAVLFNTEKLNRKQRTELRKLIDNRKVLNRFYKVGTEQQKSIMDYKGNKDNYEDYLNYSVFPSSSYYVEDEVVMPNKNYEMADLSVLPDTVRIKACTNFGNKEEYNEIISILNDPDLFKGKLKVTAVDNEEIKSGNYDAVLVAFNGYKSNFLFDLYSVFLRVPDLNLYKVNLYTSNSSKGKVFNPSSFRANSNFLRLDAGRNNEDKEDLIEFGENMFRFMESNNIGDKQHYAANVDELENKLALGSWLFSIPSLSYFSTQFDSTSIKLYGVASQLSTIEKWKEND